LEAGAATIVHFRGAENQDIYNRQQIFGTPMDGDDKNENMLSWADNRAAMRMVECGHVSEARSSEVQNCFAISKIIVKGS